MSSCFRASPYTMNPEVHPKSSIQAAGVLSESLNLELQSLTLHEKVRESHDEPWNLFSFIFLASATW